MFEPRWGLFNQEDMLLDEEMEDLKHKVKRLNEDLEYASRGVRTQKKDEERRRLERELMVLMHEEIPELERRIKDRDERKEREKRPQTPTSSFPASMR